MDVNRTTYMRYGFLLFFCRDLTQSREYDRSSLLSIPFIKSKNGENKLLLVTLLTLFVILLFLPTSQDIIHRFFIMGVCVSIYKSDVNYDVSLDLLWYLYENVTSCLQSSPPLTFTNFSPWRLIKIYILYYLLDNLIMHNYLFLFPYINNNKILKTISEMNKFLTYLL